MCCAAMHLETKNIIRRLKTEPSFFAAHIPCVARKLLSACFGRARLIAGLPANQSKEWPSYLPRNIDLAARTTLLLRQFAANSQMPPVRREHANPPEGLKDLHFEFQMMFHRWGWLLHSERNFSPLDESASVAVCRWIEEHRGSTDSSLWEPYSTGERVVNLLFWAHLNAMSELDGQLTKFVYDSLNHVYRQLEYYGNTRTNNHYINNARALLIGGAVLGEQSYLNAAVEIIRDFHARLVSSNGVLRERSTHYQVLYCSWLAEMEMFARLYEHSKISGWLQQLVAPVRMFTAAIADANWVPKVFIGDLSPDDTPASLGERMVWLCGSNESGCPDEVLADDWCIVRKHRWEFIASAPSQYPPAYPTHGHNDVPSFCLSFDAEPLFVDPGRYSYDPDPKSVEQIEALSHNLASWNGLSPCVPPLRPGFYLRPYAECTVEYAITAHGISLRTDGPSRYAKGASYIRAFDFAPARLTCTEHFHGHEEGGVELVFVVDHAYAVTILSANLVHLASKKQGFQLRLPIGFKLSTANIPVSREYGRAEVSQKLVFSCEPPSPLKFEWILEKR